MLHHEITTREEISVDYQLIHQMSPGEKYALFTEITFLLRQNSAKLKHLNVSGFPLLLRVISGNNQKGKMQVLRKSQRIQELFDKLLKQLDTEIKVLRIRQIKTADQLDKLIHRWLNTTYFLIDYVDRNKKKNDYDEEMYRIMLQDVDETENELIAIIDNNLPPSVRSFRILRIIPQEMAIITQNGVTHQTFALNGRTRKEISPDSFAIADNNGPYQAAILPFAVMKAGEFDSEIMLDYNTYQMMHYMHIHKPKSGQYIVMIDYYDNTSYFSGYLTGENGTYETVFENMEIAWGKSPSYYVNKVTKYYREKNKEPHDIIFAKSFKVEANIENMYSKIPAKLFELDENWLYRDEEAIAQLLRIPAMSLG